MYVLDKLLLSGSAARFQSLDHIVDIPAAAKSFARSSQDNNIEDNLTETGLASENSPESPIKDDRNNGLSNLEGESFASTETIETDKRIAASSGNLIARSDIEITSLQIIPAGNLSLSDLQPALTLASKSSDPGPQFTIPEFTGVEYTYGDATEKKESIKNRWAIGAQFAPTYSYREISTNYENQGQVDPNANSYINENEEALMSYAGGLNVEFAVSKRWSLQSGMYFSRIGQVNNDALEYIYNGKGEVLYAVNTSTGNINISFEKIPENIRITTSAKDSSNNPGSVQIEQNFDFFEVPFLLKYKVLNRKFSVNLTGGLSPAYLVENKTYLKVDSEKYDVGDAANLNSLLVNTSIGLGLEYKVLKQLSLSFEPTFKYSLVSLNKGSQFYYHPYSLSWFTGIKFSF